MNIFSKKPTAKEALRESKWEMANATRGIEREIHTLQLEVLDDIGVDVASQLSAAPKGKIAGTNTEAAGSSNIDELEKRLAALRNP